jgi:uncharacterized protein (TIGR02996 family)
MDEEAFLAAIQASPVDDTLRLVYADWLEEHGDRRSEFLRAAVAARSATDEVDRTRRLQRLIELRPVVSPVWVRRAYPSLAEDDIREVIFRELVGWGGVAAGPFLRVEDGHDPSPYLFALVAGRCRGVRPASAAELRQGGYHDKLSGQHGCMVSIDGLRWTEDGHCAVEGACFVAPLMANGDLYRVESKDGWWAVVERSMMWIS